MSTTQEEIHQEPKESTQAKKDFVTPKSKVHPYQNAGPVSQVLFRWCSEFVNVSVKNPWRQEWHYDLPPEFQIKRHKKRLLDAIKKKKSVYWAVLSVYKWKLLEYAIMVTVSSIIEFTSSIFNSRIIDKIGDNVDVRDPEVLASFILDFVLLTFIPKISTLISNFYSFEMSKISIGINIALYSILNDRIMEFSVLNSEDFTEGFLANLVQIDAEEIGNIFGYTTTAITRTINPIIAITYMFFIVSDTSLTIFALLVYLSLKAISMIVLYFRYIVTKNYMLAKDKRMSTFRNIIQNLDFIKINGLENNFAYKIYHKREQEIKALKQNALVFGLNRFLTFSTGSAASLFVYLLFTWNGNAEITSLGTFNGFLGLYGKATFQLHNLVYIFVYFFKSWASVKRIDRFFNTEINKSIYTSKVESSDFKDQDAALIIDNGTFVWKDRQVPSQIKQNQASNQIRDDSQRLLQNGESESSPGSSRQQFVLRDITLRVSKGERVAILGDSNSGKSSLLYSIIGEMIPVEKNRNDIVKIGGSIAYLSQKRWVIGDTVRENICLGKEYDPLLMEKALEASQLTQDLKSLTNGLDTMMSDNADTVSGGQRARIGLARCFYQK